MQIKNIVILDTTGALDGTWTDISNLVAFSVEIVGLDTANVWVEASNDPNVNIDGPNLLTAPSSPALSQYTPITSDSGYSGLPAQTYYVKTTYITKYGETLPSAEASLAVTAGNILTIASPAQDAASQAIGWNAYVGRTTGSEVLQTVPAYTPGWKVDLLPGIHFTTNGALPIGTPLNLLFGINNSGIAPPSSSTSGGPSVGVNISGTMTGSTGSAWTTPLTGSFGETQVLVDTTNKLAMVNPSCLVWKWLRVRKGSGGSSETVAFLMGQNG
jgi:hypothetical protein